MSDVKRWSPMQDYSACFLGMRESVDGAFVRFDDYAAALSCVAEVERERDSIRSRAIADISVLMVQTDAARKRAMSADDARLAAESALSEARAELREQMRITGEAMDEKETCQHERDLLHDEVENLRRALSEARELLARVDSDARRRNLIINPSLWSAIVGHLRAAGLLTTEASDGR